jgi:hypothetical protein
VWYESIIHAPTHFIGEASGEHYYIKWIPGMTDAGGRYAGLIEGPTFWVLGLNVYQPVDEDRPALHPTIVSNPTRAVVDFLALLFGKAFSMDGLRQSGIHPMLPLVTFPQYRLRGHPCMNEHVRADYPADLYIGVSDAWLPQFLDLLQGANQDKGLAFVRSLGFYAQGVRDYDTDAVAAFLAFVSAIESLAQGTEFTQHELASPDIDGWIRRIREVFGPEEAERLVGFLNESLSRSTRRFLGLLSRLVGSEFFGRLDTGVETSSRMSEEKFRPSMTRLYSLRSRFLHAGLPIGEEFLEFFRGAMWETAPGSGADYRLGESGLPTLLFMERVTRYILLRFFGKYILEQPEEEPDR